MWRRRSVCIDTATPCWTDVSSARVMTRVVARIRNRPKMIPPTHQIAPPSPPTNTRSKSGRNIHDSTARVDPSTIISAIATPMRGA